MSRCSASAYAKVRAICVVSHLQKSKMPHRNVELLDLLEGFFKFKKIIENMKISTIFYFLELGSNFSIIDFFGESFSAKRPKIRENRILYTQLSFEVLGSGMGSDSGCPIFHFNALSGFCSSIVFISKWQ